MGPARTLGSLGGAAMDMSTTREENLGAHPLYIQSWDEGDWIYPRPWWVRLDNRLSSLSSPQCRPRGAGPAQDQMDHLSVRPDSGWASMCECVCVRDSGERKSSIENNMGCEGVMARQPSAVARPSWNPEPRSPRRDDPGLAERRGLEKPRSLCLGVAQSISKETGPERARARCNPRLGGRRGSVG